jgi:hypothetical protein
VIIEIFVTQHQSLNALAKELFDLVFHVTSVPVIDETTG